MGRIGRWLARVIEVALSPLVSLLQREQEAWRASMARLNASTSEQAALLHAIGASAHASAESLAGLQGQVDDLTAAQHDLMDVTRSQTEAVRAWEDALLGRVMQAVEGMREDAAERERRLEAAMPYLGGLARLMDPDKLKVVEERVRIVAQDDRLKHERPDLRAKLVTQDIVTQRPDIPFWEADLLRAICYARVKGRI